MSKAKISGIKEVRAKLQRLKNISNDDIVMAVAERGKDIAESLYGGESIVVTTENLGGGKARIVASGEQVAFLEYGTGVVGESKGYGGQLPTEPITFESRGKERTTQGWVHNYYAKYKREKGENAKDFVGFPSQAQMWKTATELTEKEAEKAIKDFLNEKGV